MVRQTFFEHGWAPKPENHNFDVILCDKPNTFWYPEVEIFRQNELGDWKSVVEEVVDKIKGG